MSALAYGFCDWGGRWRLSRWSGWCRQNCLRLAAPIVAKSRNGVQQLEPVTDCGDAKLLQRLVRQARKNRLVYLILAECRLILLRSQTTMSMWAPTIGGRRAS
jgi:hypothetical protein